MNNDWEKEVSSISKTDALVGDGSGCQVIMNTGCLFSIFNKGLGQWTQSVMCKHLFVCYLGLFVACVAFAALFCIFPLLLLKL